MSSVVLCIARDMSWTASVNFLHKYRHNQLPFASLRVVLSNIIQLIIPLKMVLGLTPHPLISLDLE
jgi:hypothetical protein